MAQENKTYLNKFNSVKSSQYGFGVYIKSVDELYQELKSHANPDGSIRLYVSKKQTPDKYGNDGTVTLNTWKPDGNTNKVNVPNTQNKVYAPTPANPQYVQVAQEDAGDLPF